MIETIIRAKADLNKEIRKTYLQTLFVTDDSNAHRFDIEIVRDDEPITLPDTATVSGFFIRYSDNATIPLEGSIDGNAVTVTLKKSCYNKNAQFAVIVKAMTESEASTVFYGEGTVHVGSTDTYLDEENVIPSLSDLLAQIAVMEQGTQNANAAADNANAAAGNANEQAEAAKTATEEAQNAAQEAMKWADATATAQTLPAGSQATVNVATGETGAKMLTFGIPCGVDGADGEPGKDGKDFSILGMYDTLEALQAAHPTGNAGDAWAVGTSASNTVYLWDTDVLAWVNVGSLQGAQGAQGEEGKAATVRVGTVTTLDAGMDATVTNVGTETDAIFDFAIPRGANDLSAEDVGALSRVLVVTAVLAADGWSAETPFTQTVTLGDILGTDVPDADIDMSEATADTAADIRAAWSLVDRIDTGDGTITVTCFDEAPGIELNIRLKVVR